MHMKQVIKDVMTTSDGESFDHGRIFGSLFCIAFIAISIYAYIFLKQTFDPVSWGTGAGGLFTGIGANLFLKSKTEP